MKKKRIIYFGLLLISVFLVSTMYFSYAFFTSINEEHGKLNIVAGTLNYKIEGDGLLNNQITVAANTRKEITLKITSLNDIDSKYELYYIVDDEANVDIGYNTNSKDSTNGEITANSSKEVTISIRNNTSSNQKITFGVEGGLKNNEFVLTQGASIPKFNLYAEKILNGATPVLTDNLIPVNISDNGTVTKADLNNKWYSYEDKNWANAVVLKEKEVSVIKDSSGNGNDGIVYGDLVEGYGYASFDGTDDYIDTSLIHEHKQPFTIGVTFKYNNIGARQRIASDSVLDLYINENGGLSFSLAYTNSEGVEGYAGMVLSGSYFTKNNWYSVIYTYDGTNLKVYLNGKFIRTNSFSKSGINNAKRSLKLGANNTAVASFLNTKISNAFFYDRCLTEEEAINYHTSDNISNKDLVFNYNFFDIYNEDLYTISEDSIESYFVWIPKYSYQLWDLGNYNSLTAIDSTKPHAIPIKFGLTNTSDSKTGECTTPGVAGESGNCKVGDYMTHPAFLAFDSNGMWVGKFETGYDGAESTETAEVNSNDSSKIIIKPNVYIWRSNTVGNMFKASYDYLRNDESHMIKNTEWGAVAYLQHSSYGSAISVRINNNSAYITGYSATVEPTLGYNTGVDIEGNRKDKTALGVDGAYTINYLNSLSIVASSTGNKTGIYDMSGGATEYTMGYNTKASNVGGSSGITDIYNDFFTNIIWDKYYDKYSSTANINYNNRILGDATGEIGPFERIEDPDGNERNRSSWHGDISYFTTSTAPWIGRGAHWSNGIESGIFAFRSLYDGSAVTQSSFRIVLTPAK